MRNIFLLPLLCILLPIAAQAADHISRIELLKNEKWWGLFVGNSPLEPFMEPFDVNTRSSTLHGFHTPMLCSSAGRYIWSAEPMEIAFDGQQFTIRTAKEPVQVRKGGRTLREAYLVCCHKHFPPAGKIPSPELFTRPVYDTRGEFGLLHTQQLVTEYAYRIQQEGLPAGTILIGDGWQGSDGSLTFDRNSYPDPRAFVADLHRRGFRVMLTVTPYMGASGRTFLAGREEHRFLEEDGKPLLLEHDNGYEVCLDMGNPQLARQMKERLRRLQEEYDIDGFRFDCRAVMPVLQRDRGALAAFMKNWTEISAGHGTREYAPGGNTPLAPYVSCIRHEGTPGWELVASALNDALNASLCGFPYSHLTFGHRRPEGTDGTLLMRLLQCSALMPVADVPFAPWKLDEKNYAAAKDVLRFRDSIAPYVASLVEESARTAEPIVRHMEYQFPRNGFADCNDQFMLGPRYLIAPCLDGSDRRTVRLPRGTWTDRQGRKYKGPLVVSVDVSGGRLACFESNGK